MPLLAVPALAGALVARSSALTVGLIGALALGVVQSTLQCLSQTKDWWPDWAKQGLTNVVPFAVLIVALFVLGRAIPTRGDDVRSSLPAVLIPRNHPRTVTVWSALGLAALALTSGTYRFGVITSLAVSLIALSLVLLTGMLGQISLAQAAFAGVAGTVLSKLGDSVPFPLSLFIAAALAAVAGVLVGIPALRIRGAQLAVVTLAAALTLQDFVLANPKLVSATANLIPDPALFGWSLSVRGGQDVARLPFGVMVLVIVVVASVCVGNLMRAGTGRTMLAIRSNERAAAAIGINVPRVELTAFAASSFPGGPRRRPHRLQPRPAVRRVLRGVLRPVVPRGGISLRNHERQRRPPRRVSASLGIVYVFMDRNLHLGSYYMLITGVADLAPNTGRPSRNRCAAAAASSSRSAQAIDRSTW
ncbi:branched-chain amino acid transport system permease protein, partial [Streptomyces sp. MnatMP-M27]